MVSGGRRIWPTIPPAGVRFGCHAISTPDDHFTAGPDCRVRLSASGRVGGAGGCPTIRAGIVSPASIQTAADSAHPRQSFHCRSTLPCDSYRAEGALVVLVAVQLSVLGLYLPPVLERQIHIHPRRSFHCQSKLPCERARAVGRVGACWWLSNYPCWDCISRRC